ncbi:MAG: hypothetical protein K2P81_14790 [Bacteriovoracaceae bacterium]|nr:hypothetical protein [Bacteriovoracaceae bacterium]
MQSLKIIFSAEANEILESVRINIPEINISSNEVALLAVHALADDLKKVWLKLTKQGFYGQKIWLTDGLDKIFINSHLDQLLKDQTANSQEFISEACVTYFTGKAWRIHHTKLNWIWQSDTPPCSLTKTKPSVLKSLGFFQKAQSSSYNLEEALHQKESLLKEIQNSTPFDDSSLPPFPEESTHIDLPRAVKRWETTWRETLTQRHSSNLETKIAINLESLGSFLDLGFAQQKFMTQKSYSSSGGLYCEHLLIECVDIHGVENGTYLYYPEKHRLYFLTPHTEQMNPLSLIFASQVDKMRGHYQQISSRLMLLNTGVLIHQASLVCALLNWSGHAVGKIETPLWKERLEKFWPQTWQINGLYLIH